MITLQINCLHYIYEPPTFAEVLPILILLGILTLVFSAVFSHLIKKYLVKGLSDNKENPIYQNLNVLQLEKSSVNNNEFVPFYPVQLTNSIFVKIISIILVLIVILTPIY